MREAQRKKKGDELGPKQGHNPEEPKCGAVQVAIAQRDWRCRSQGRPYYVSSHLVDRSRGQGFDCPGSAVKSQDEDRSTDHAQVCYFFSTFSESVYLCEDSENFEG